MKQIFSKKTDRLVVTGKIDPNGMKFFVDVEHISEEPISRQDILDLLKDYIKIDLVDMDVIQDILQQLNDPEAEQNTKDRRIAKGKPSETGADGKLLLMVKALTGEIEMLYGEEDEANAKAIIDYRNIRLFDNIEIGSVVARIYEPKLGADGYDAQGKPIPGKRGNPCKVTFDKTLSTRAGQASGGEFTEVVAQEEGFLFKEGDKLSIQNELVIKGNLDYRSGNLDYIGSVKVLGDMMTGFRASAKKNVEVKGMLRGENVLVSRMGDVIINDYAYGGPYSKIIAASCFHGVILQEVNLEVAENAYIKREVVDSSLRVGGALHMPEGAIIGGVTRVVKGIEAKQIGNEAFQRTTIIFCNSVEATMEYERLINDLDNHNRAIELLKSHLGPLVSVPNRIELLKEPFKSKMNKLFKKLRAVEKSREELLIRQNEMLQKASSDIVMKVNFTKKLYPGVLLVLGEVRFEVKEEKDGPGCLEFDAAKGEFVEVEYKELPAVPLQSKDRR